MKIDTNNPVHHQVISAFQSNNINLLKKLYEEGIVFDHLFYNYSLIYLDKFACFTFLIRRSMMTLHENMWRWACRFGRYHFLEYLHQQQCPWNKEYYKDAISQNHLGCIKFLVENNYPYPESVLNTCIFYNKLHILSYLIEKAENLYLTYDVFNFAICHGTTKIIDYLIFLKCPIPPNACLIAIKKGNIQILRHLHEKHNIPLPLDISNDLLILYGTNTFQEILCIVYLYKHHVKLPDFSDIQKEIIISIYRVVKWIERTVMNRKINGRMEIIKEELIQKTWHPRRVLQWCLDHEERTDLNVL